MTRSSELQLLTDELVFGEGPRWHEGKLWFSDILGHAVKTVDLQGNVETVVELEGHPSGLGWRPDGTLLIVSMLDQRLLGFDGRRLFEVANMTGYASSKANDMVVDHAGHAFVGHFGFDYDKGESPATTNLLRIDPGGSIHIVATDVACPNGMAISEDGETLIVGQSMSNELLGFDLAHDGRISNRRVYASMPEGYIADGICVDVDGGVWVACPIKNEFIRVLPDGSVSDRISTGERHAIACALGGERLKTLFCLTAASMSLADPAATQGRIETVDVHVPAALCL